MALRMACEVPGKIAGVAAVAVSMPRKLSLPAGLHAPSGC